MKRFLYLILLILFLITFILPNLFMDKKVYASNVIPFPNSSLIDVTQKLSTAVGAENVVYIRNATESIKNYVPAGISATAGAAYVGGKAVVANAAAAVASASSAVTAGGVASVVAPAILAAVVIGGGYVLYQKYESRVMEKENVAALSTHLQRLYENGTIPKEYIQWDSDGRIIMTPGLKDFLKTLVTSMPSSVSYIDGELASNAPVVQLHRLPYVMNSTYREANNLTALNDYVSAMIPGTDYIIYLHYSRKTNYFPSLSFPASNTSIIGIASINTSTLQNVTNPSCYTLYNYKTNQIVETAPIGFFYSNGSSAQSKVFRTIEGVGQLKASRSSIHSSGGPYNLTIQLLLDSPVSESRLLELQADNVFEHGNYTDDINYSGLTNVPLADNMGYIDSDFFGEYLDQNFPDGSAITVNEDKPIIVENSDGSLSLNPDAVKAEEPGSPTSPEEALKVEPEGMLETLRETFMNPIFPKTFERFENLKDLGDYRAEPPKIMIPLLSLFRIGSRLFHNPSDPAYVAPFGYDSSGNPVNEVTFFDFGMLDDMKVGSLSYNDYMGDGEDSVIDYFRMIISFGVILMTFRYVWRKIIPEKAM